MLYHQTFRTHPIISVFFMANLRRTKLIYTPVQTLHCDLCSRFCKNKTGNFIQFIVTKYSIMSFPLTRRIFLLPPNSNYYLPSVLILRVTSLRSSVISRSKKRYYFDHPQVAHSYS